MGKAGQPFTPQRLNAAPAADKHAQAMQALPKPLHQGGIAMSSGSYDRASFKGLTFHDAVPRFLAGQDNPRAYLERCLEAIAAKDGVVRAFVVLNEAVRVLAPMPQPRATSRAARFRPLMACQSASRI